MSLGERICHEVKDARVGNAGGRGGTWAGDVACRRREIVRGGVLQGIGGHISLVQGSGLVRLGTCHPSHPLQHSLGMSFGAQNGTRVDAEYLEEQENLDQHDHQESYELYPVPRSQALRGKTHPSRCEQQTGAT